MIVDECETMTPEHIQDFRNFLRVIYIQVQELCYFYEKNGFDVKDFVDFADKINETISTILKTENFSERRKPILEFEQEMNKFSILFIDVFNKLMPEITESMKILSEKLNEPELLNYNYLEEQENNDLYKKVIDKIKDDKETQSQCSTAIVKGTALNLINDRLQKLKDYYQEFPKEMPEEEKEKYRLKRKVELLEREKAYWKNQYELIEKERNSLKAQLSALDNDYKILNESFASVKKEKEVYRRNADEKKIYQEQMKDYNVKLNDEILCGIKDLKTLLTKFIKQEGKDFEPENLGDFIAEEFDDFQDALDLLGIII